MVQSQELFTADALSGCFLSTLQFMRYGHLQRFEPVAVRIVRYQSMQQMT